MFGPEDESFAFLLQVGRRRTFVMCSNHTGDEDENPHLKVVLHEIDPNTARNDIRTYLKAEFAEMASGSRDLPNSRKTGRRRRT